ncbi:MAG: tetratricopeptide repeat protein [Bryobacteraceae bacterium]
MKSLAVSVLTCALLFASACNQSPQRLVDAANRYHDKKKYQEASILYRKAIAKDKTHEEAYYREGLNLLDQKNAIEAAKFFRRAVDLNPNNTDAEIKLSEIYLTAYASDPKKFRTLLPEVKELTAKILARDPKDFNGIRLQAFLFLADKNLPKALECFEEANEIRPYSPDVVGWLVQVLVAGGQWERAEKLAQDMIAHNKSWGPAYDFLFVQYLQRKRQADAENVLKERVANDPASETALINYTNYLLQTNRYGQAQAQMQRALNDPRDFPNGRLLMGDFYLRAGHFEQGAEEYRIGANAGSKDKENYQLHLVEALAREGASNPSKQAEALNLAKKISSDHPKDAMANQVYASLLLDSGVKQDVQKSLNELENLVRNNNADPVLHFDLARAYYSQNNLDKAQSEALETVRLRPSLTPGRVILARIYEDRGQHGKALDQTGIVLAKNPDNPEAKLIRVEALVGLKEFDKAQAELETLVKQNPGYGDAVYSLAKLYMQQKDYGKAQEQFEKLWQGLGPNGQPDLRGFIGLQEVKLHQGHWQEAVQAIQTLADKNPGNPAFRYTLANFQADAGTSLPSNSPQRATLLGNAEANYREVLKATPNSVEAWMRLGTMERILNQNDAALASFDKAITAAPGNADAYLNRAMLLEVMGEKDRAREAYGQTLGVDPNNIIALNNLAFLTADNGQNLDQAMTYAERAKKRLPNNPNVCDTLGYVYYRKNLLDDAIHELESAVGGDPQNASYRFHLAMALLKRGDKAGAKREAESALRTANTDQQQKIKTFMSQIS